MAAGRTRPVLRSLFCALFMASSLLTLVDASPVRVAIQYGTSHLRETDLLALALVASWMLASLVRGRLDYRCAHAFVYALVLVLLLPVFIGLAAGKPPTVVLRDLRTPVFFFAILPMLAVQKTDADLRRLFRVLVRVILLGTLAQVVYTLLVGFGGGSFFDYTGQGLVLWLVCLTLLVRTTDLACRAATSNPCGSSAALSGATAV